MTLDEAAHILRQMYRNAPDNEKVVQIHLFGIKYALQLEGLTNTEIVGRASIPPSYHIEVAKGRKLAKYVSVK